MYKFLLSAFLLAFSFGALAADAPPHCEKWLKGVTKFEDMKNGKIIWRFSIFNFSNWNPNDQFTAAVLIKNVEKGKPAPQLEVSYVSEDGSKTEHQVYKLLLPFELDPRLKEFDDFKPRQFFQFELAGKFTLKLKSGDTVLCAHTGKYGLGH